jgi:hypothetical protein
LPKAAMLSHYNLIAEHMLVYEQVPKPYTVSFAFILVLNPQKKVEN